MHITRIEVRHWRRHDQMILDDLSERINLICGPNEAGKSTIAEALRFALFEPCKPNYDTRKAIQQRSGSDAPEVDVDFLVDGRKWHIQKRFLKRPMSKLVNPEGRTSEGDEAEQQIQELLGFSIPSSGRVTKDVDVRYLGLWPILWLRQGELSGLDGAVTEGVRGQLSELVAREVGSVATGQLGSRALTLVQREYEKFWTVASHKPTADYAKALKERDEALIRRNQALVQLQHFEATVKELQTLTDRIGNLMPRQRIAEEQAEVARQRARQAHERLRELEQHRVKLSEVRRAGDEAEKHLKQRSKLESELVAYRTEHEKAAAKIAGSEAEFERQERAQIRLDEMANALHQCAKESHERAEQAQAKAERTKITQRISERSVQMERIENLLVNYKQSLAEVNAAPEMSSRNLGILREKTNAHRDALVQRDSAATTVIFHAESSQVVSWSADGEISRAQLQPGETFNGKTIGLGELHLPNVGTIRIRAGIGDAADLAQAARQTGDALEHALQKMQVKSLDEAEVQAQTRMSAVAESKQAAAALNAALGIDAKSDAHQIATAVAVLQRDIAAEQARLAAIPELIDSDLDPEVARLNAKKDREIAENARHDSDRNRIELQALRERLAKARTEMAILRDRVQRITEELGLMPLIEELMFYLS